MGVAPVRKAQNTVKPERAKKLSSSAKDPCSGNKTPQCSLHGKRTAEERLSGELIAWAFECPEKPERRGCSNPNVSSSVAAVYSISARQVVSKYDVQYLLAEGRYSQVFQVQCKSTRLQYALKAVQRFPTDEGNSYKLEIGILSRCDHPSIVALHDVVYARDRVYLFLELAAGGDLRDRISDRGHYSERSGRVVLRMVLDGLSYLHCNGITHRDVKLENLLCKSQRDDSRILITDFGLAHVWSSGGCDQTRTDLDGDSMSTTCGTAEYMSPEMLEGEEYCAKVDAWAFGVVAYAVLSGEMPFDESSGGRARLYQLIMKGQYSFSAEVCRLSQLDIMGNAKL